MSNEHRNEGKKMRINDEYTRKEATFCRVVFQDVTGEDFNHMEQVLDPRAPESLISKLKDWKETVNKVTVVLERVFSSILVKYPMETYNTIWSLDSGAKLNVMEQRLAEIHHRFFDTAGNREPVYRIVGDPFVGQGRVEFFFGHDVFVPPSINDTPEWRIKYRVGDGEWKNVCWNVDTLFRCYPGFYRGQEGAVVLGDSRHPFSLDQETLSHIQNLDFQCIRIFLKDNYWHIFPTNREGMVPDLFPLSPTSEEGAQVIVVYTDKKAALEQDQDKELLQLLFIQLDEYGNDVQYTVPPAAESMFDTGGKGLSPMLSSQDSYLRFRGILLPPYHCGALTTIQSWQLRFNKDERICSTSGENFSLSIQACSDGLYLEDNKGGREKLKDDSFSQAPEFSFKPLPKDVDSEMNIGIVTCGGKRRYLVSDNWNLWNNGKTVGRAKDTVDYQLKDLILGDYSLQFVNSPPVTVGARQFNTYCVSRVQAELSLNEEEQELTVKQRSSTFPIYIFDSRLELVEHKLLPLPRQQEKDTSEEQDTEATVAPGQFVALGRYLFEFAGKK